jgi:hypothetical protein
MLRYMSGMAGVAFGSYYAHIYEEYNEDENYTSSQTSIQPLSTLIINENIIYKPITNNDKLTCCITQEDIYVNARYMSCSQCSNNFDENAIKNWFSQRPHRQKCPMCRVDWTDYNVYINEEEPRQFEEPEILDPPTTT